VILNHQILEEKPPGRKSPRRKGRYRLAPVPGRPRPLQKGFWQAGVLARGAGWAGATAGTGVGPGLPDL